MLTKDTVISKIEILEDGVIQVRTAIRVYDDGVLVGEKYHRAVFDPTMPLSSVPLRVRPHANIEWTPEVIAAYRAKTTADL